MLRVCMLQKFARIKKKKITVEFMNLFWQLILQHLIIHIYEAELL